MENVGFMISVYMCTHIHTHLYMACNQINDYHKSTLYFQMKFLSKSTRSDLNLPYDVSGRCFYFGVPVLTCFQSDWAVIPIICVQVNMVTAKMKRLLLNTNKQTNTPGCCLSRNQWSRRMGGTWPTGSVPLDTWSARQRPRTVWGRCSRWPPGPRYKPGGARRALNVSYCKGGMHGLLPARGGANEGAL